MRAVARLAAATILGLALVGLRQPIVTTFALFQALTTSSSNAFSVLEVRPATLNTASASGAVVHLAWSASPTASTESVTYGILRRPSGSGAFAEVASTSALSYDDAPGDGRYDYEIRAAVTTLTADSNALAAMVDTTPPTAATGVSAATGPTSGTVNLNWTAGTDATSGVAGYTIRYVQINKCPAPSVASYPNSTSVGAVTTATLAGLVSGKPYCFYLITVDRVGLQSGPSNVAGANAK